MRNALLYLAFALHITHSAFSIVHLVWKL